MSNQTTGGSSASVARSVAPKKTAAKSTGSTATKKPAAKAAGKKK